MARRVIDSQTKDMVTSAYKLGLLDGEQRAKQQVQELVNTLLKANNDLLTTNKHLRDLVTLMDKGYPLSLVGLSLPMAEAIVRSLRNRNKSLTGQIQEAIDRTQKRLAEETARMEEMLAEVAGEE